MTGATLLLRQVHPSFIQAGRVTSQAFRPTPKDEGLLSVYDGDQITPAAAWDHFTRTLASASVGSLAVTVDECTAEQLAAKPDPEPFLEHVVVDFTALSDNQAEKKGKKLRVKAEARGWQHQASASA